MSALVLANGRVIDPATGHDATKDVRIDKGWVVGVGPNLAQADDTVIDVSGLVVGPGFVDLHSHTHSVAAQRLQALDGVTTALDLEVGLMPVATGYARAAAEGRPLNYGFSASWTAARGLVLADVEPDASFHTSMALLGNPRWLGSSTAAQQARWLSMLEEDLQEGALGIGIMVGYAPQPPPAEYLAVARLAARAGVATFTHVRELVENDPSTPVDGPTELIRAAAATGARMHHCHVNSTSRRHIDRVLHGLERCRTEGATVTVEAYPYGAGATFEGPPNDYVEAQMRARR